MSEADGNVVQLRRKAALAEELKVLAVKRKKRVEPPGGKKDDVPMRDRLNKLEGQLDTLKVVRPMTIAVLSTIVAALALVLTYMNFAIVATNNKVDAVGARVEAVGSKVDAIPGVLRDEFRAMRAEMSAQTSAIANAVTAARGAPTQVILVPAPQPAAPGR